MAFVNCEKNGYPIVLTRIAHSLAVVIGGGKVGERKVNGLLAAGADVKVISPRATEQLRTWAEEGRIQWKARSYQPGDLDGAALAYAATNCREVNAQVAHNAHAKGILCNVVDVPDEGNFHVPAVYRGHNVVVTVSTYGADPARARDVRDRITAWLEEEGLA
jgi:cobalt-precorrin 5A hydrolase/precorrin-3B C17-methyltransferase